MAEFVALLERLRSADNAARGAAEKAYTEAKHGEPGRVLASLAECLLPAAGREEVVRTQAATLLRRAIVRVGPDDTTWTKAGGEVQARVKVTLFLALEVEASSQVRKIIIAGIAAVAAQSEDTGPWPELVPNAFRLAGGSSLVQQESGLRLLAELVGTPVTMAVMGRRDDLGGLVGNGLGTAELQVAALNLVCEMITVLDAESCQAMQPVLPMIEGALKGLGQGNDATALEEALQALITCAEDKATFFKPRWREWVDIMFTFAAAKGVVPDGSRAMAFEWISTVTDSKGKALVKAVPNLPQRALETAFLLLAEVDEDEDWEQVDEEEEEDDDDSLFSTGEAKVDFFVKKCGFKDSKKALAALLQQYASPAGRWEAKFAACMAIRASVEYVDDPATLDMMAQLLLQLLQDPHMRVRYAALHALGQLCHDQGGEFHERWHARLIPPLARAMLDPVDRVAAMSAGCLEALIADLDEAALETYAPQVLEVFVGKLTTSSHKGVLVAVMEALGALAAGLEGGFGAYYDQLMSMLLAVVGKNDASPQASLLRGKAFECISLLGYSVGRERFGPAARQTMQAMLAAASVANDVQTDCIRDAMGRICQVMGQDFAPFLPALLPGVLAGLSMDGVVTKGEGEYLLAEENEDELTIPTDDGFMKVKTSQIGEMLSVVGLLEVMIKETGAGFYEYVRATAEVLAKILGCAEAVLHLASDIRDAVYPCWAGLVQVASKTVPTKGQEAQALGVELVQQFVDKVGADLARAEEPEDIGPMANGVASVVRNAGAGCLQPAQVTSICDLAIQEILKSLQREKAIRDGNPQPQDKEVGGQPAFEDEDDEEDCPGLGADMKGEEEEEEEARVGLCAIVGACMKADPGVFVSHAWPTLQTLMKDWFADKGGMGRLMGFHIACDLCDHLGEQAVAVWPVFMDAVLEGVLSPKPTERNAAAFAVCLGAQSAAFGQQYAGRAYVALGTALQKFKPKKTDEDAQRAQDNIVAALVQLCLGHAALCPDLDGCWTAAFAKLPLKVDTEEGQKIHRKLFDEAQKPSGGALGSMARVARVLGLCVEIYGRSEHCDDDLERDISLFFVSLPQGSLEQLVEQLPPKQKKKAERVLREGRERSAGQSSFNPPPRG